MKSESFLIVAALALALASDCPAASSKPGLVPNLLRCEYRVNPLGIDETAPRLNWIVEASAKGDAARGQKQTAYQIVVASDGATVWDTGKVASDETIGVVYAGKPLVSQQRCEWKVKVWDRDGNESAWSKPAMWTMGLLKADDWKAEWIGYDKARTNVDLPIAPLDGAKWIWHSADPQPQVPAGYRLFVSTLALPADAKIAKAELLAIGDDGYKVVVNTRLVVSGSAWQMSKLTDVTAILHGGDNSIRVEGWNAADGPAGFIAKLTVTTADGKTITHVTDGSWKSTNKPGANWHKRDLDTVSWPAVRVIGDYGMQPWGKAKLETVHLPPVPFFRTSFRADKPVVRATLYATALGLADFRLNGQAVSDEFFTPGWTDYTKRVHYRAYDVTALIRSGENALGATLADGWFSGYVGYGHMRDHYGKLPRLRAQLNLQFADGATAVVATGPNWKAATGPILEGDFLMGETYDARRELSGWDAPGFDDAKWEPVVVGCDEVHPKVEAHPGPAVRVFAEVSAKSITEPQKGVYVLNLGQNFAGVPRLKVKGAAGQKIVLRFAERLNPDGAIYTTNLRSARATDTYICRGGGWETWVPRSTFHGFQYVEITGLGRKPSEDTVVGLALSSDTPVAGSFNCSDPMLNRIHSNGYWTQRANFIDIPTDCPQRDERLGWTGDAQVYVRTATLNCDVQPFFTKWLVDLCQDGQREDGQFPMVAPVKVAGPDGGPAWQEAGVICPWTIYEVYGDRRVLERNYDAMAKFIAFCKNRSTSELLPPAKYHCFGDWLSINADTPKDIIYEAYFAYSTKLMARIAEVLGKTEDAAKYRTLFEQIKAAFNKAYVAEDGRIRIQGSLLTVREIVKRSTAYVSGNRSIEGDTQTCYVLALMVGLVDGEKAQLAAKYLVENIEARDNHLSTGFIGTKDLMLALAKIGRNDVAYRLIHNDTFPSWGFSIKQGATSIWERWDGWTPEKGFQDPGMNSFAHYSFGAVYQWMVENIGGIRNDGPAYKKIVIAPTPDGKLTSADVRYDSIRGRIETAWKKSGDKLTLNITIPANTAATVLVPAKSADAITESGKPLAKAPGVKFLRMEGDCAVLEVEAGSYRFETRVK